MRKQPSTSPCELTEALETRVLFAANLLVNPTFAAGDTGFTSQYVHSNKKGGGYLVGTNPHVDFGPAYASFKDHTPTSDGKMFMADGATTAGKVAWQETLNLEAHSTYRFSGWAASIGGGGTDPNPASLRFSANGGKFGAIFTVPSTNSKWAFFSGTFNTGNATSTTIRIIDQTTTLIGNDFALDDLALNVVYPNLLKNPTFSQGNVGFSTQYVNQVTQGGYKVGTDPKVDLNSNYASLADHTPSGDGLFFMADGAIVANKTAWQETISITPGKSYRFSGWTASLGGGGTDPSPARLALFINGSRVGKTFTVPSTNSQWAQFSASWNAGSATKATIRIVDLNTNVNGNDFALDDLHFARTN